MQFMCVFCHFTLVIWPIELIFNIKVKYKFYCLYLSIIYIIYQTLNNYVGNVATSYHVLIYRDTKYSNMDLN